MVVGVTDGYRKGLEIDTGVGYRAALNGKKLTLNLGYSHPVNRSAGWHQLRGQPDPPGGRRHRQGAGRPDRRQGPLDAQAGALGKGVRYAGEVIRRKAGKAGKVGGKK